MQPWPISFLLKSTIHLVQCVLRQEASRSKLPRGRKRGRGKEEEMESAGRGAKEQNRTGGASDAWCGRIGPLHLLPQREAPPPESRVTSRGHLLRLAIACDGMLFRWDFAETKGNQWHMAKATIQRTNLSPSHKIFLDSLTNRESFWSLLSALRKFPFNHKNKK